MGIHTADAIVLRRYPYRETSVIVTCLTNRYGKLKGLVKGLMVQPNRHRGAMELLTINRIVFYDTHSSQLHLIAQCDLAAPFLELQGSLETMRTAAFCAELVDTVVPLEEPQPAIYQLLKDTLGRVALEAGMLTAVRVHFVARLLRLAGFQPQVDQCTGCSCTIQSEGYWSARHGGLLCSQCLHEDPKAEAATPDLLTALEELLEAAAPSALEPGLLSALSHRLDEFLQWRLDRPLKTMNLIRSAEFGTRNAESKADHSELRIPNSELPV